LRVTPNATEPSTATNRSHRVRRVFTWVLVVVAALLMGIATVAVWASRTVFNDDRFSATVTDVVSDAEVISAASTYVTDQVEAAVVASGILDNLPTQLQPVVGVLRGAVRGRVEAGVNAVLSSDAGQRLLIGAAERAHSRALQLLEGGGLLSSDAISIENGTVTLNLVPVVREALIQLQQDGLIPSSITIPTDASTPGPIANALGERLPDDFGQVVVYQTDVASNDGLLDQAQRALVVAKRAVVLLVILAVVAAAGAILLAVDRRRTVFRLGVAITIVAVVLIVVARRVTAAVARAPATPGGRAVANALGASLRSSLVRALVIVAIVAVATAVVARYGDALALWSRSHQDLATIAAVALGLLILLVLGLGWASLIFAVIVTAAAVLVVRPELWRFASRTPRP
jgi:hypothetical protein